MASLKVPRGEGRRRIDLQVTRGNELAARTSELQSDDDYVSWREDRERWVLLTAEVLGSVYEGDDAAEEFRNANAPTHVVPWTGPGRRPPARSQEGRARE